MHAEGLDSVLLTDTWYQMQLCLRHFIFLKGRKNMKVGVRHTVSSIEDAIEERILFFEIWVAFEFQRSPQERSEE